MTRERAAMVAIIAGIVLLVVSGAPVVWASTFDNPDFAEPLIWLFAGSVALTKVATLAFRSPWARAGNAERIADAAAVAGTAALMLGEGAQ